MIFIENYIFYVCMFYLILIEIQEKGIQNFYNNNNFLLFLL